MTTPYAKRKEYISQWRKSPTRPRAECHPERPNRCRGMCSSCYQRWLYANNDAFRKRVGAKKARWADRNKDHLRESNRRQKLQRLYGLTPDAYAAMLSKQDDKCAICKSTVDRLHVDHDHTTGKVRALLCLPCNGGLAWVERIQRSDDEWLAAAYRYLEEHS